MEKVDKKGRTTGERGRGCTIVDICEERGHAAAELNADNHHRMPFQLHENYLEYSGAVPPDHPQTMLRRNYEIDNNKKKVDYAIEVVVEYYIMKKLFANRDSFYSEKLNKMKHLLISKLKLQFALSVYYNKN